MSKDFTPVTLEDRERYYELWQRTPCRSLDYTLANLWGWQALLRPGVVLCGQPLLDTANPPQSGLLGPGGRLERRGLEGSAALWL